MILQNLYNKVLGFFRQTDAEQEQVESAKDTACNRLRVVLMQDRTNLTPELMERMRKEMVELLSKYVEMDKEALELNLEQDGDQVALMLSIPVIRAKDEEEIKEALAKEDAEETATESENESDEDVPDDDDEKVVVEETEIVLNEESLDDDLSDDDYEEDEASDDDDKDEEQVKILFIRLKEVRLVHFFFFNM